MNPDNRRVIAILRVCHKNKSNKTERKQIVTHRMRQMDGMVIVDRCRQTAQHPADTLSWETTKESGSKASCSANWALKYDGSMWKLWNPNWFTHLFCAFVSTFYLISFQILKPPIFRWFMECSGALGQFILSHNELEPWNCRISFNKLVCWAACIIFFIFIAES